MPEVTVIATIIAIDGPAASGKGTLARRLADHLGLRHLDSGRLYRAVAAKLLRGGGEAGDAERAVAAARALTPEDIEAPGLRDEAVGQAASILAPIADVRAALLGYQRDFAAEPPGAVVDGRDIGTVVFPEATHKFFVTASLEVRVGRRCAELADKARGSVEDALKSVILLPEGANSGTLSHPLIPSMELMATDQRRK